MIHAVIATGVESDLGLATRCASGDRSAQRQLFQDYRQCVHATLYRILGSNRDMEDLVQEAFLQVFQSIRGYRGEARLVSWIARVTARTAYGYLSSKRAPTVALEAVPEAPSGRPGAEREVMAREALRRLYGALDRVEAKQRIAFTLHVIDGKSLREVAEITDATVVATKTRVWRARKEIGKRARKDPLLAMYLQSKEQGA